MFTKNFTKCKANSMSVSRFHQKKKHSKKVFSTESCRTHQMFSLEEDCAILVQSIAKNNTEVLRNTQFSHGDFPRVSERCKILTQSVSKNSTEVAQ